MTDVDQVHPSAMERSPLVPRNIILSLLGSSILILVVAASLIDGTRPTLLEVFLSLYAAGMVAATYHLGHRIGPLQVDTLVGWSFSLVLAPLLLLLLHTQVIDPAGGGSGTFTDRAVTTFVLLPTAWGLSAAGLPSHVVGDDILISTTQGELMLNVGLVCAGLYPMIVFLGVLGHHAWRLWPQRRIVWTGLAIGLVGLYLTNLVRLVLLVKIGAEWGIGTLHMVHANLGWLLFASFLFVFWNVFMRQAEPTRPTGDAAAPHESA